MSRRLSSSSFPFPPSRAPLKTSTSIWAARLGPAAWSVDPAQFLRYSVFYTTASLTVGISSTTVFKCITLSR
eukprot:7413875-Pyramimonas_sp.AAC.1